jgi:hypothetical protein
MPRLASVRGVVDVSEVVPALPEDVCLAISNRANLLLVGKDDDVEPIIAALRSELLAPVTTWRPHGELAPTGTLLLRDLGAMTQDDQHRVDEWLEATVGLTYVISTTRMSLLPRVRAAGFLERLYYRLNTICLWVGK